MTTEPLTDLEIADAREQQKAILAEAAYVLAHPDDYDGAVVAQGRRDIARARRELRYLDAIVADRASLAAAQGALRQIWEATRMPDEVTLTWYAFAIGKVRRLARNGLTGCICPDEDTRVGNCPRHGQRPELAAKPDALAELAAWPRHSDGQTLKIPRPVEEGGRDGAL